eukprot:s713_g1.t2
MKKTAAEVGWSEVQKDQDGRAMRGDGRKLAHKFNIFQDISSEDDDGELDKERRGLTVEQILERSPKYADKFLDKVKPLLVEPKVSKSAAGGAFTMLEEPKLMDLLNESAKTVQRHVRKCRTALKQMNWAMTSLLAHKDSPWRGLEVKGSLAEHGCVKLLELMKSGMAVGKFSEVHEEEFAKLVDNLHRLYMDIFERRGQVEIRLGLRTLAVDDFATLLQDALPELMTLDKAKQAASELVENAMVNERNGEALLLGDAREKAERCRRQLISRVPDLEVTELLKAAIQAELNVIYLLPESGGRLPDGSRVLLQDLVARADLNGKAGKIASWDFALQRYTVEIEKEEKKKETEAPANPDMFGLGDVEEDEEDDTEKNQIELAVPKKLMVLPKNVLVDLGTPKKALDSLVKDWNVWRKRPRSVSASQDAEAVAAALGPPLESMANFLQDAAQAVATGSATGRDGAELIADDTRQALSNARNLAAKLLGEEPQEPPKAPPLNEPAPALVPFQGETVSQALKEAAEVAQASIELNKDKKEKKRSRSRKRRRKRSSSSSSSGKKKRKK